MSHQFAALIGAAAVAIAAQADGARGAGERDLQGIWTNATLTPLERPAELAGKEFLTEAEAAAFEKRRGNGTMRIAATAMRRPTWPSATTPSGGNGAETSSRRGEHRSSSIRATAEFLR